jgi:hypothetical protein
MNIINDSKYFVIDISNVINSFNSIPPEIRRPPSIVENVALTDADFSNLEIEGLVNLIEVQGSGLNAVYDYCDDYINGTINDVSEPTEDQLKDANNYLNSVVGLADSLKKELEVNGFYGKKGYLCGSFHKVLHNRLLVLHAGIEVGEE